MGGSAGTVRSVNRPQAPKPAASPRRPGGGIPTSLLAILALLLPALIRAAPSPADDRVLRVHDGASERRYPVAELIAAVGLSELRVAEDPHFGPDRVFAGFALEALLDHVGLGVAP